MQIMIHLIVALVVVSAPQVQLGEPPSFLKFARSNGKVVADETTQAFAGHDMPAKNVLLTWRWLESEGMPTGDNIVTTATQTLAVPFWPTCVTPIGGMKVAVAGKQRSGETVIEVWTLSPPLKGYSPEGPVLTPQPVQEKATILEEAVPERDMVLGIFPNLEDPDRFFVQYYSSRDLYDLTWNAETPTQAIVWSSTQLPWLAEDWDSVHWGKHSEHGNVVIFMADGFTELYLIDSDCDGVLDAPVESTAAYQDYFSSVGHWLTWENVPQSW